MLAVLLSGLSGNWTPQAKGNPEFVTDSTNYILIENDYFIANISKGLHGSIKNFYIKPNYTVNIVASGYWGFLAGEEAVWAWNSSTRA